LQDKDIDGRVTDLTETGQEILDWIRFALNKEECRALVNTVMNLRVAERLSGSQEGLCSMDWLVGCLMEK